MELKKNNPETRKKTINSIVLSMSSEKKKDSDTWHIINEINKLNITYVANHYVDVNVQT